MTKTVRPNTLAQTSGGKYVNFTSLNNIKTDKNYAQCLVGAKSATLNRPSVVTVSNFKAGLPTGAIVTNIKVKVKHQLAPYNGKNASVPAPSVSIMKGNKIDQYDNAKVTKANRNMWSSALKASKDMTHKGKTPTTTAKEFTCSFNHIWDYSEINSKDFGVKIDYPTNTGKEGYLYIYYVKIVLTYISPKFTLKLEHLSGEYNGDEYSFNLICNNVNNVKYIPSVTVTAPSGFSLSDWTGNGTLTVVSARVLLWTPKLGRGKASDEIQLVFNSNVTYSGSAESYSGTFSAVESLNQRSASRTVSVTKTRPVDSTMDNEPDATDNTITDNIADTASDEILTATVDEVFDWDLDLPTGNYKIYCCTVTNGAFNEYSLSNLSQVMQITSNGSTSFQAYSSYELGGWDNISITDISIRNVGAYVLVITETSTGDIVKTIYVDVKPSLTNNPYYSVLELSEEEINRLGDGYVYTAQTFLKVITTENYVRNWGRNFRLGVFNNLIQDNTNTVTVLSLSRSGNNLFSATVNIGDHYVVTTDNNIILNGTTGTEFELDSNTFSFLVTTAYAHFTLDVYDETDDKIATVTGIALNTVAPAYSISSGNTYIIDEYDYTGITPAEIMENAEFWSEPAKTPSEFNSLECKFRYNAKYPIYLIVTGDYPYANKHVSFIEPAIIEDYEGYAPNGVYPAPILNTLAADGSISEVDLEATIQSDTIVFYDFPLADTFNDESITVRGFKIGGRIESNTDDIILNATLVNGKNESHHRSIVLDASNPNVYSDNEFNIGQSGDLFGFRASDLESMEDCEVHLQVSNVLNDFDGQCQFGDVNLTVYTEEIIDQPHTIFVDGEDISRYGAFIQNIIIPSGIKTDTDYITVDGTDINDPFRQNITRKTIELEFDITACDLESATLALRELTRLFTNERDRLNRPVPKRVEFSHYPDVYFEYVMEEPIDADVEIASYNCKAKLIIPSGTAYDKVPTSTGTTGYVSGLVHVKPYIQFSPTSNVIAIKELYSEQEFNMGYSGDWTGKIIEINCNDRVVLLKNSEEDNNPVDISSGVDINSDWFRLSGEYEFQAVGCAIRSIDYAERW